MVSLSLLPAAPSASTPKRSYEGSALHSAKLSARQPWTVQEEPVSKAIRVATGGEAGGAGDEEVAATKYDRQMSMARRTFCALVSITKEWRTLQIWRLSD